MSLWGNNLNNPVRLVAHQGLGHTSVISGLNGRTLAETVMENILRLVDIALR